MRCIYPSLLCTVPLNCIIDKYTSEANNSSDRIHLPSCVQCPHWHAARKLGWALLWAWCCVLSPGARWRRREWHTALLVLETGCWCWRWCRCESLPGSSSHMGRGSTELFWAPAAFHLYLEAGPGPGPSATMGQGEVTAGCCDSVTGSRDCSSSV